MPPTPGAGSGINYKATPSDLAAGATATTNTANSVQGEIGAIRAYVNALEDYTGPAKLQFESLMIQYDADAKNLIDALDSIAAGLQYTYRVYTDTEQQNVTNIGPLAGGLPAGKFS
jgi:WXG100 family type VII secretion target